MDDVTRKIERVAAELREIETDLMWTPLDDAELEKLRFLDEPQATRVLTELKLAVDAMRRFLWAYIEAADRYRGAGMNYALQTARLKRATEMLQTLHRDTAAAADPDTKSLLERVTKLVGQYEPPPES
jgi:seryl-tRNA synthetase